MLSALNDSGAEYLVVGAYALAVYGLARSTGEELLRNELAMGRPKDLADAAWIEDIGDE